jgi:hypothetical protein
MILDGSIELGFKFSAAPDKTNAAPAHEALI